MDQKRISYLPVILLLPLFFVTCKDAKDPPVTDIAVTPEQFEEKVSKNLKVFLEYADDHDGGIGDSTFLSFPGLIADVYKKNGYTLVWGAGEAWKPIADSMIGLLAGARYFGLFPEDYHYVLVDSINKRFASDKWREKETADAALWSKVDLMLSDAFFRLVKDIKLGRLPKDSISAKKDSVLGDDFYVKQWQALQQSGSVSPLINALEPRHQGYWELKGGLRRFLDSSENRSYTFVPSPGKDTATRGAYKRALQRRLFEGGFLPSDSIPIDSIRMAAAVKKFQKQQGLTADGVAGETTLKWLNFTDRDRFVRIAITMDRYKRLPDSLPSRHLWVNLPAYSMRLFDHDTIKLASKIVCGKPVTRTPLLTSGISEIITYPLWTVPNSIIIKEILPAAKKDPGYFAEKGFSLIDKDGNEVDPYTVEWQKYSKGIPYKVVQGSGDDNALGVLKFNFNNKYSVYLHDTNQRYLFSRDNRSLSHGCVRVQEWEKLAYAILKYDNPDSLKFQAKQDSLKAWLGRKEKHSIWVRNRLPLYIRYFTCEGKDGNIVFYDDMYGEDKLLRERYFAGK